MAQKVNTVSIKFDDGKTKDFTIKELTIQNIIDLSQSNSFFKAKVDPDIKKSQNGKEPVKEPVKEKGFFEELQEYGKEIEQVMEKTCDFKLTDLKPLAPSDIRLLYDSFQEVNQDFLGVLEKLKILEMFSILIERHTLNFSKMLAIL